MCFGNKIGFAFLEYQNPESLFAPDYGSLILEILAGEDLNCLLKDLAYRLLGVTKSEPRITVNNTVIDLEAVLAKWQHPLETIFPTKAGDALTKS